jgi:hypothetical protein
VCLYLRLRKFRHNAERRHQKAHKFRDKNRKRSCVGWNRTVSVQVDCGPFPVATRDASPRRTRAVHMSRNSEVDMYHCFLVRALSLVHMGLGPDHEGQEQCHYRQRNLDHFPHAGPLYQNDCPYAKCGSKDDVTKQRFTYTPNQDSIPGCCHLPQAH